MDEIYFTLDSRFVRTADFVAFLARLTSTSVTGILHSWIRMIKVLVKKQTKKISTDLVCVRCPGLATASNSLAATFTALATKSDP